MTNRKKAQAVNVGVNVSPRSQEFRTGTGQVLFNIHLPGQCATRWCVIHRPKPGPWSKWPTNWRSDRRIMERVCPCGIGHPAVEQFRPGFNGTHGCCGCPCTENIIEGKVV